MEYRAPDIEILEIETEGVIAGSDDGFGDHDFGGVTGKYNKTSIGTSEEYRTTWSRPLRTKE